MLFLISKSYCQNFEAGEILFKWINGYTYEITLNTYTKITPAENSACQVAFCFGDSSSATLVRTNGPSTSDCPHVGVQIDSQTLWSKYQTVHSFPGPGNYIFCYESGSRLNGIINIPNSINHTAQFNTQLLIPMAFSGSTNNSSPTFLNLPLISHCANSPFSYNPLAVDTDSDSLSYSLISCKSTGGAISGYNLPAPGIFAINAITGELTWDCPTTSGDYNIVIKIDEWRKNFDGQYFLIGSIERETMIILQNCTNIKEIEKNVVSVFPNPVSSIAQLYLSNLSGLPYKINILNIHGQNVLTFLNNQLKPENNIIELDLKNLEKGIYFLELTDSKKTTCKKIIKQ